MFHLVDESEVLSVGEYSVLLYLLGLNLFIFIAAVEQVVFDGLSLQSAFLLFSLDLALRFLLLFD